MKRGDCGCRNHLGRRKVKYPSRDEALHQIITRHLPRSGGMAHAVYPCPRFEGAWHIRSVRKAAS